LRHDDAKVPDFALVIGNATVLTVLIVDVLDSVVVLAVDAGAVVAVIVKGVLTVDAESCSCRCQSCRSSNVLRYM